jgi:hypothetical protein
VMQLVTHMAGSMPRQRSPDRTTCMTLHGTSHRTRRRLRNDLAGCTHRRPLAIITDPTIALDRHLMVTDTRRITAARRRLAGRSTTTDGTMTRATGSMTGTAATTGTPGTARRYASVTVDGTRARRPATTREARRAPITATAVSVAIAADIVGKFRVFDIYISSPCTCKFLFLYKSCIFITSRFCPSPQTHTF